MFMEDFCFYWTHRFLHTPFMYKRIHKVHHEATNVINFEFFNSHWIEFILGNLLPVYFGSFFLKRRIHIVTLYSWFIYRITESNEAHSGLELPYSIF